MKRTICSRPFLPRSRFALGATAALVLCSLAGTMPLAAGNIRAGYAQVDPGLDADATFDDFLLSAGLDSGSGFSLGFEGGDGHLGFGLELTQSSHDVDLMASDGVDSIDLSGLIEADLYTALLALRYRFNPDSTTVFSLAAVGGAIGYLDLELPDGDTADGGTAAYGLEAALDIFLSRGWFFRLGYRFLEADIDLDELDPDLADQLRDNPFEPSIAFAQVGYSFGHAR